MKKIATTLATAGAVVALAGAAQAEDFKPKTAGTVLVNLRVTDVMPVGSHAVTTLGGAATGLNAKVGDSVMPTLGISYFITDHVAVELIAGSTQHTVKVQGAGTDLDIKKTWVLPPVLALQYHFTPAQRFSPYVGAGLNYMWFYSGENLNGFHLKLKDGVGYALQAGADYAITGRWSANLDVKKIFFETRATDAVAGVTAKVNLDPWVISAGAGYRF